MEEGLEPICIRDTSDCLKVNGLQNTEHPPLFKPQLLNLYRPKGRFPSFSMIPKPERRDGSELVLPQVSLPGGQGELAGWSRIAFRGRPSSPPQGWVSGLRLSKTHNKPNMERQRIHSAIQLVKGS